MGRNRVAALTTFAVVAGGLVAYALTYRPSAPRTPSTMFAYTQQAFSATRTVTRNGFPLHVLRFRSYGGVVQVDWYDSAVSSLAPGSGDYATLIIDQQPVADALTGSYYGPTVVAPATLRWAGSLPAGEHRFEIELSRVDQGVQIPLVRPGGRGVDSLSVTQEPGD